MKRKLLSLVLASFLTVSVPLCAFAASGFDLSVFKGQDDIKVVYDDMADDADISVPSLTSIWGDGYHSTNDGHVYVYPKVISDKDCDAYCIMMEYGASDWEFIDSAIIKIGDHRYKFGSIGIQRKVEKGGSISEFLAIIIDNNSTSFMQDLIEHRDEEIKVRLEGEYHDQNFSMSKSLKDGMINLYNLYVAAGGTREGNLEKVGKFYNSKRSFSVE